MFATVHSSYLWPLIVAGLIVTMLLTATSTGPTSSLFQSTSAAPRWRVVENYGRLPPSFQPNAGPVDGRVKFILRGRGYTLCLTGNEPGLELWGSSARGQESQAAPAFRTAHAGALSTVPQPTAARPNGSYSQAAAGSESSAVLQVRLVGANNEGGLIGEDELPGKVNYFIGNDPARWRVGVPTYAQVRYTSIYPGVDLVFHGNPSDNGQLEFDFAVAPHANPKLIRLRFGGPNKLRLAANGDLVVTTPIGTLTLRKPAVYQMLSGHRHSVAGDFALLREHTVGLRVGIYDRTQTLVIDPVLAYSTFLGGSRTDAGKAIAVDSAGNAFVAGSACSTDFPVTSEAFQTINHAAANNGCDAFVTKMNPTGTGLVYSTYLGGSGSNGGGDTGNAIAVDAAGNVYLTGQAYSTDFPVTLGAFQTTNKAAANSDSNAFVAELNPTGSALIYSTYLGGSGLSAVTPYSGDNGNAIAVDAAGNAYVAGETYSLDFPVTPGAFQTTNHAAANVDANAFVTKLNPAGTALIYSTYLGGSGGTGAYENDKGHAVTVDASGHAYVAGETFSADFPVTPGAFQATNHALGNLSTNAFVTEVNATGTALVYSTYLGGSGFPAAGAASGDKGNAIVVDPAGDAYVAGVTYSTDFPVTQGAFQMTNHATQVNNYMNAFVTKLNPAGTALVYSTYLGGSGGVVNLSPTLLQTAGDVAAGLAIDSSGNAYVAGFTPSADFPLSPNAFQSMNQDQCVSGCIGGYNAFLTELNSTGSSVVYSTYLGGNGINPFESEGILASVGGDQAEAVALDNSGDVYLVGSASSSDFPISTGAFQTTENAKFGNAFVSKLNLGGVSNPSFSITGTAVTVTAGAVTGNTSIITVTPTGGFTGSVALTAAVTSSPSGAQDLPTLSFGSTTPVSISGNSAGTATLTVTTTAPAGCTETYPMPRGLFWFIGCGAVLVCVMLVGISASRRRLRLAPGMLALLLTLVGGLLACGGGSGSPPCGGASGTTPGTYAITVTGTSGGTAATGTVSLTVQ